MYTNADCYVNKMHELRRLVLSTLRQKPGIIAITEVTHQVTHQVQLHPL